MLNFSTARISFLTIKHFQNFPGAGTAIKVCSGWLTEQSIFFLMPHLSRKITCLSFLKNNRDLSEYQKPSKNQRNKRTYKGRKVSVTHENNVETYMYLEEAEKYAKSRNLSLVELNTSSEGKIRYKLQRGPVLSEDQNQKKVRQRPVLSEDQNQMKVQSKRIKQVFLKEGISKNDLLTKVNQMLKLLEKEFKVICIIETKDSEKMENIVNEINTNGLQAYSLKKVPINRGVRLTYEPNCINAEKTTDK